MSIHTASLKGLRPRNEDEHTVKTNLNKKNGKYAPINMYAVFDGHGGNYVSKYLKEHLHNYFISNKVRYPVKKKYVNKVYDHVQNKMSQENKTKAHACGSTCLVVLHYKDSNRNHRLQILNTGDSRAVLCSGNMARRLTLDHKPGAPKERARIEAMDGGKITFDGHDFRIKDLSVSRAFGDNDSKPYVVHKPDIFERRVDKNDKFMILACDGLWDVMSDQDAIDFVLSNSYDMRSGKRKPDNRGTNIAKKLASHAIQRLGSTDNVSILVVFFK